MYKSYKSRRMLYEIVNRDREMYSKKDVCIAEGTTKDFTLSINDVADILGFCVEHVQNNILQELEVYDLANATLEDKAFIRHYMNNNRLKKCVSKSSLERYITSSLSITDRREIIEIPKDSDLIKEVKEVLGKRAKIQELFNDVGNYLDIKYNAKQLMNNEQNRIERLRAAAVNKDNDFSVLHYLETGSLDVAEIIDYYNTLENNIKSNSYNELFDIFAFDMYSIKDLKEKFNIKHTMQVYRYIDKVSHIAIKLNNDDYDEDNKKLGDRNIRYIISNKDLKITKGVYRLPIDYYVFQKLQSMTQIAPGVYTVEDVVRQDVLDFAEANKDKYIKKEKEG